MVGDDLSAKLDYNYKTGYETWRGNQEFQRQKNASSQPPLDSTPDVAKILDPKTLTTDFSKRKEKAQR